MLSVSKSNAINALIFVENLLGVYRNYSLLSRRVKCLAICRLFIEITFFMLYYAYRAKMILDYFATTTSRTINALHVYYSLFLTVNSLTSIILSYYFSNRYKQFIFNIDEIHKLCENDMLYKRITAKTNRRCYMDLVLFVATVISMKLLHLSDISNESKLKDEHFIVLFLVELILQWRYHTESVVFYELSELIASRLEYLNESISKTVTKLNRDESRGEELRGVREELHRWGGIRRLLAAASHCLRDCLGTQIALALYSSMPIYIGLLYISIDFLATKGSAWSAWGAWNFTFRLALYLVLKVLILVAGQHVQNQADVLETSLAKLHCLLVRIPGLMAVECARSARSLRRRVRGAPVRVRLRPMRPVRAALLVDVIAVVLNYTIILLQFNHVV